MASAKKKKGCSAVLACIVISFVTRLGRFASLTVSKNHQTFYTLVAAFILINPCNVIILQISRQAIKQYVCAFQIAASVSYVSLICCESGIEKSNSKSDAKCINWTGMWRRETLSTPIGNCCIFERYWEVNYALKLICTTLYNIHMYEIWPREPFLCVRTRNDTRTIMIGSQDFTLTCDIYTQQ